MQAEKEMRNTFQKSLGHRGRGAQEEKERPRRVLCCISLEGILERSEQLCKMQ